MKKITSCRLARLQQAWIGRVFLSGADVWFESFLLSQDKTANVSVRGFEMFCLLLFQMISNTSLYDFACVYWNYSLEDWSTDGCSKGNASDGLLRCFCNHTTNFAALWVNTTTLSNDTKADVELKVNEWLKLDSVSVFQRDIWVRRSPGRDFYCWTFFFYPGFGCNDHSPPEREVRSCYIIDYLHISLYWCYWCC